MAEIIEVCEGIRKIGSKKYYKKNQKYVILVEKLAALQRDKEKCESDRFANVDQFMAGTLDKDVYQRRRAELSRTAESLDAEFARVEQLIHSSEVAADDEMAEAYGKLKKYSGEEQLTQKLVQELIDKVLVTDPEHIEIVWKFSEDIIKFIME